MDNGDYDSAAGVSLAEYKNGDAALFGVVLRPDRAGGDDVLFALPAARQPLSS